MALGSPVLCCPFPTPAPAPEHPQQRLTLGPQGCRAPLPIGPELAGLSSWGLGDLSKGSLYWTLAFVSSHLRRTP